MKKSEIEIQNTVVKMNSDKKSSLAEDITGAGTLGIELLVSVLLGSGAGYLLDKWLGTEPWILVVGAILGAIAGFRQTYLFIVKSDWDEKVDKDS